MCTLSHNCFGQRVYLFVAFHPKFQGALQTLADQQAVIRWQSDVRPFGRRSTTQSAQQALGALEQEHERGKGRLNGGLRAAAATQVSPACRCSVPSPIKLDTLHAACTSSQCCLRQATPRHDSGACDISMHYRCQGTVLKLIRLCHFVAADAAGVAEHAGR